MKAIKKIVEVILTIISCLAFVMMTAEAETWGLQILCTLGSAGVLVVCCKILDKMGVFDEKESI